jgi:hypothetical protein
VTAGAYDPRARTAANIPVRGTRVEMPRNVDGTTNASIVQTICRAEDDSVPVWSVNLAPIFLKGIGPQQQGMPGARFPPLATGSPVMTVTFGGGGVSWRQDLAYPRAGAVFNVAADNVNIEVRWGGDPFLVYTEANTPVASGWVKPAIGNASVPLLSGFELTAGPIYGPRELFPYSRAIWIASDTPGATITVTLDGEAGASVTVFVIGPGPVRFPTGSQDYRVTVTTAAGGITVAQELVFA